MFCPNCGAELEDDSAFCTGCGKPLDEAPEADVETNFKVEPEGTRFVADDISFGGAPTPGIPSAGSMGSFPSGNPSAASLGGRTDTMYASGGSQPQVAYVVNTATPQPTATAPAPQRSGGNRTVIVVVAIAVIAIAAIAAIVFMMLRPQGAVAHYNIQFETDGGTAISAVQVDEGGQLTSPSNPTKSGYEFAGWYTDSAHTQQATFPFTPKADTVLYAKWEEKAEASSSTNANSGNTSGGTQPQTSTPQATTPPQSNSSVNISVVGADGSTRTATIRRQGSTQRVLPDGNTRRYSASELSGLSDAERCIAWNEIIAASNGYAFKNSGLANYFNGCSWYRRVEGASASGSLSAEASANVELLKSMTDSWWKNLATY